MKAYILSVFTAVSFLALPAFADEEGGVGIVAGDTNGITVKIPTMRTGALDLAAGIDLNTGSDELNPSDGRFRADWQVPIFTHRANDRLYVPVYIGAGAFVQGTRALDDIDAGLRAPLGIALDFKNVPLEFFAQTGIEARVIDNGTNDKDFGLNGAVGMRIHTN